MQTDVQGYDEPNLAFFPLFQLSGRASDPDQTSIEFEAPVINPKTGRMLKRRLIVSGKEAGRLPIERDDVLLTHLLSFTFLKNGLTDPVVSFSRNEMMKFLDWTPTKEYYDFMHRSLLLWRDIKLTYIAAWFNRQTGTHHNLAFQFLGDVHTEVTDSGMIKGYTIVWNHTLFTQLQQGFFRNFNRTLYRNLSPIGRRLYRFLGKDGDASPCYQVYELYQFARHHIGLTEKASRLKAECVRNFKSSFEALEQVGFVEPAPDSDRYRKRPLGGWEIHIRLKTGIPSPLPAPNPKPEVTDPAAVPDDVDPESLRLLSEITIEEFGTGKFEHKFNLTLAAGRSPEYIAEKIEYVRARIVAGKKKDPVNNAWGLLVDAIRRDYHVAKKQHPVAKVQQTLNIEEIDVPKSDFKLCVDVWERLDASEQQTWRELIDREAPELIKEAQKSLTKIESFDQTWIKNAYIEALIPYLVKKNMNVVT